MLESVLSQAQLNWPEKNLLFYGDNLTIMRKLPAHSIDLIYLDPPFNSQQTYNLLYRNMTGLPVPEQEEAFCDAWEMDAEKEEMVRDLPVLLQHYGIDDGTIQFWKSWTGALRGTQPRLLAYLVYMSYRLLEMHRLLKDTGSIFLHCDPTASHYIKIMMDGVFGYKNFRNEIIWKRTTSHNDAKKMGAVHDVILYYTKSDTFAANMVYGEYTEKHLKRFKHQDDDGRKWTDDNLTAKGLAGGGYEYEYKGKTSLWRVPLERMQELDQENRLYFTSKGGIRIKRYLDELPGSPIQDVWTDINPINSQAKERMGYPTQKPQKLLERIIQYASNEGDIVFDPFCGCGTTIRAAEMHRRRWIGCDIAILAVRLIQENIERSLGLVEGEHYEVDGIPNSLESARALFEKDPRQFQHWVVELAGGFCNKKQSGDKGVDGRLYFHEKSDSATQLSSMVISVKGGKCNPAFVRELRGTLEREREMGVGTQMAGFIMMDEPTKGMKEEAAVAGLYKHDSGASFERFQIRTVDDLLNGQGFSTPVKVQKHKQSQLEMKFSKNQD